MATFIVLANWTDQGAARVASVLDRTSTLENLADKMGCRLLSIHWTLGAYDSVATIEAPDDETFAALAGTVASQGNVRTQTLRAFGREEMVGILERMG